MWCAKCQQEIAAVPIEAASDARCPTCRASLIEAATEHQQDQPGCDSPHDASARWDAFEKMIDDWTGGPSTLAGQTESSTTEASEEALWKKWEDSLAELDRLLWRVDAATVSEASQRVTDLAKPVMSESRTPSSIERVTPTALPPLSRSGLWAGRLLVALGMLLFGAGAALGIWALVAAQPIWVWVGLGLYLGGQVAGMAGLAAQVEAAAAQQKAALEAIERLRADIGRIEQATTLLAGPHSLPSQSFYVHFAQRANPHVLLADLKNQLDLLTLHLANRA